MRSNKEAKMKSEESELYQKATLDIFAIASALGDGIYVIDNSGKINFVGQTQTEEIASWKNDELIFRKTSLKEAFKTFARYQDLDIEFKDKSFENKLFSGKFNTLGIDNFLFAIQKIYPINILKNQNKIIIN